MPGIVALIPRPIPGVGGGVGFQLTSALQQRRSAFSVLKLHLFVFIFILFYTNKNFARTSKFIFFLLLFNIKDSILRLWLICGFGVYRNFHDVSH